MPLDSKGPIHASNFEIDSPRMSGYSKFRMLDAVDGVRTALTTLALCAGVTITILSADALATYDATHLPAQSLLPLWPEEFDLRPTVALVVCGALLLCANAASVVGGRVSFVRHTPLLHTALSLAAPAVGLVAAIVAVSFFYAANTSQAVDTLESWSCRWQSVYMTERPHFGTLCKQSHAAAYLSIFLIPLETLVLGIAGWQTLLEKNTEFVPRQEKRAESAGGSVPSSRGET